MIGKKNIYRPRKPLSTKNHDFITPDEQLDLKIEIIHAIVSARIEKKLSQNDLAAKLNIAQSSYARFESCRTNPTLSFLQKVMYELDLELEVVAVNSETRNK